MAVWVYDRIDASGRRGSGTIAAESFESAYKIVSESARYSVTNLVSTSSPYGALKQATQTFFDSEQNVTRALINWWKLYRVHVAAGNDKLALTTYIPNCPSAKTKQALEGILAGIELHGQSMVAELEKYPTVFDPAYVAMLQAASANGRMAETLSVIIHTETAKLGSKKSGFVDRIDAFITYIVTGISMIIIAKAVVPGVVQQAADAKLHHSLSVDALVALGIGGSLLTNPFFYLCLIPIGLGVQWLLKKSPWGDAIERGIEALRWRIPIIREGELAQNRSRCLRIINDARFANLHEERIFDFAIATASSRAFADSLRRQRDSVLHGGERTLEQSMADNAIWGQEITSYFASRQKGTWHDDVTGMLRTLAEDEEQNRRLASYAGTGIHVFVAIGLTAIVTIVVTIAQFAVLIASARSPY